MNTTTSPITITSASQLGMNWRPDPRHLPKTFAHNDARHRAKIGLDAPAVHAHRAQKVLQEMLAEPDVRVAFVTDVTSTGKDFEMGIPEDQKEHWKSLSEDDKELVRKDCYNTLTEQGRTLVSCCIRADILRRRREGKLSELMGLVEMNADVKRMMTEQTARPLD